MELKTLQKKYPQFIYEKYSYEISGKNLEIFFDFKIVLRQAQGNLEQGRKVKPNIFFNPKIIVKNVNKSKIKRVGKGILDNLIFHLGLMEIPSYWKSTCSPKIEIRAGFLNKEQISWWKNLFISGLGQFFYENKIDFRKRNFLKISTISESGSRNVYESGSRSRILVPVGGGKDSVVTVELLKKKKRIQCFVLNPNETIEKIMKVSNCQSPIVAERKIDPKLLELNRQGFLNGHTPFSAYLAFLSVLVAVLFDYKYIAISNERSSNEGNVRYLGKIINHQWSKSFDFEKKFRNYSKKYLTSGVEYFSFLRPLYEIQIAKLFSQYPKYLPAFLSCNVAYQTKSGTKKPARKWCGNCPKCLFVFVALYPFVDRKELVKIFGKNLFENKKLLPIMQELIGDRAFKPFECVGTKKESLLAVYLSLKNAIGDTYGKLPFLLEYFQNKILPKYPNLKKESIKILNSWDRQHNLPKEFKKILKTSLLEI